MEQTKKTAIILGATGLTGSLLLQLLLQDSRYEKIKVFSRKSIGQSSNKVEEFIGDIIDLENFSTDFVADEVFCCVGTTKAKTPDQNMYYKIDYGIPVKATKLCHSNGIKTILIVSALGSNAQSKVFYNRVKGEMEDAVLNMNIPHTYIMQPSLISGDRKERRLGELVAKQIFKVLNFILIGPLKKYQSINPKEIALAMIKLANEKPNRGRVSSDQIKNIARRD